MSIGERISNLDWNWLVEEIDRQGWATTRALLTDTEREALIAGYDDEARFRSTVVMARHGFGQGEYRYFAYPLPPLIQQLRENLYERLVPLANRWREALDHAHGAGRLGTVKVAFDPRDKREVTRP